MYKLKFLSLGAGIQSTALYLMACNNKLSIDCAIFADTGNETKDVYKNVEQLKKIGNVPIHVVKNENNSIDRFVSTLPFFVLSKGVSTPVRRQCTNDYKIQPIIKKVKEMCNIKKYQRVKFKVQNVIGFSFDEPRRLRPNKIHWIDNSFPLFDMKMNRFHCMEYLKKHNIEIFGKSSCYCCPYHNNEIWKWLKEKRPDEFNKAREIDLKVREINGFKDRGKMNGFLHRSLKPLNEVDFDSKQGSLFDNFNNECTGYCGY